MDAGAHSVFDIQHDAPASALQPAPTSPDFTTAVKVDVIGYSKNRF